MRILLLAAVLAAAALAGCSGESSVDDTPEDAPPVDVTADTGGVRGVVVDAAIRPIQGAKVAIPSAGIEFTTLDDGEFAIGNLPPGPTVVTVTHPLYASAQRATNVIAGDAEPEYLRFTLERTVLENPYALTLTFDGYITCSAGTPAGYSEECGEGVGVDCLVPVVGCQRVGGQPDNAAQFDFFLDAKDPKTILVEQHWEATSPEGENFYTVLATNWTCTPICEGNRLGEAHTVSPLEIRYEIQNGTAGSETVTPELVFSTFTWAEEGVALNQKFKLFVTTSYVLPLPEGWHFGDPPPF